jgi:hypothetical protein
MDGFPSPILRESRDSSSMYLGTWIHLVSIEQQASGFRHRPCAMWTPGYWKLHDDGHHVVHDGYWASGLGWYGGINYGFGDQGVGFACGAWRKRPLRG